MAQSLPTLQRCTVSHRRLGKRSSTSGTIPCRRPRDLATCCFPQLFTIIFPRSSVLKCWSVDSAVLHGTSSSSNATQQNQHSWKSVSFHFFDSCGFTSQAPPGPLHSAVRSCCNTPRPTIFEPDLTGGTGLGSSHSVVRSCFDTPGPTIFEPDLTGGTGWVPCILLCIHVSLCTHV